MPKLIKSSAVMLASYCVAWLIAFLFVVGFEPSLMTSYFTLGWSFTGLELASFVWLLAWPILVALLLAYHFIWRRLAHPRQRAA